MALIDAFDGWMVIDIDILKDAMDCLPEGCRTLSYIEQQTNINKATMSAYLNGRKFPNLKNFKKLCIFFAIDPKILLGLVFDPPTNS